MKNISFKTSKLSMYFLSFSLFAFVFLSCQKPQKYFEVDENARTEMISQIIPLKDAIDSYKDYGKNRVKILKDTLKAKYGKDFNDTRTVWFDIETLKQYLIYVEEKSKDAGIEPQGIQFYFTVNSEKTEGKKKNHQTFFIAPTKTDDLESGYTLLDGKVVLLKDKLKSDETLPDQKTEKAGFFTIMQGRDGLLLNDGVPNPPGQ
ncbi:MAG: hypothetical protein KJO83_00215 [Bacteroidia bacterium]|nr:hypothetical protein [Bacteroidia bacterium]